jgi:hypothetical protein
LFPSLEGVEKHEREGEFFYFILFVYLGMFSRNFCCFYDGNLPSRPVIIGSYWRVSMASAGSPFMNHCKSAAGFERPDVQFNRTISPI